MTKLMVIHNLSRLGSRVLSAGSFSRTVAGNRPYNLGTSLFQKQCHCSYSYLLQVVMFDGGEYVSLAGEFNEFRKVSFFFIWCCTGELVILSFCSFQMKCLTFHTCLLRYSMTPNFFVSDSI